MSEYLNVACYIGLKEPSPSLRALRAVTLPDRLEIFRKYFLISLFKRIYLKDLIKKFICKSFLVTRIYNKRII